MSDQDLMDQASQEITRLREENRALRLYERHTERLLALFEGGPRGEPMEGGMHPDIAFELRARAEQIRRVDLAASAAAAGIKAPGFLESTNVAATARELAEKLRRQG